MPARVEVELDIFSGMPNPTWVLTQAEADSFVKQRARLPPASAQTLSNNLGYRGFVIQLAQDAAKELIRIQGGTAHIEKGALTSYLHDEGRGLERWLLNTGRPHLTADLLQIVERELP